MDPKVAPPPTVLLRRSLGRSVDHQVNRSSAWTGPQRHGEACTTTRDRRVVRDVESEVHQLEDGPQES